MKNYVVGVLSMFENDLKLFKITAENEYEAVKKGILEHCGGDQNEKDWQNSPDYPKDLEALKNVYEETLFNVIEV